MLLSAIYNYAVRLYSWYKVMHDLFHWIIMLSKAWVYSAFGFASLIICITWRIKALSWMSPRYHEIHESISVVAFWCSVMIAPPTIESPVCRSRCWSGMMKLVIISTGSPLGGGVGIPASQIQQSAVLWPRFLQWSQNPKIFLDCCSW